jgi:hypothetical protein
VTQGVASNWNFLRPHRGDTGPSSFVSESWSGGFIHTFPCWLAPSHLGFLTRDYQGKMLETTWPGFDGGGGGWELTLFDPMERCLPWLALTFEW